MDHDEERIRIYLQTGIAFHRHMTEELERLLWLLDAPSAELPKTERDAGVKKAEAMMRRFRYPNAGDT